MNEPWRLECPRGHRTISKRGDCNFQRCSGTVRFHCATCREKYDRVLDVKTDKMVTP